MKGVELYGRVRHAVQIEGLSHREAARRFGIDPRTVAKMMVFSVPPGYRRSKPPARPKLDPFIGIIDRILEEDKSRPAKQRHTSKRIFERLRDEHGYRRRADDREGLCARAPAAAAGGVRAAAAMIRGMRRPTSAKRWRRSAGWNRRSTSSPWTCRTATPASCRPIRRRRRRRSARATRAAFELLRQGAELDPLRQHQDGGSPDSGRRNAAADAGVQRAAVALPVRGSVRPARQGQRQGQGRGAGRLDPAELPGADAAGGELCSAECEADRRLPRPARRSAARSRRDDRRTAGARPCGLPIPAGDALRRLREEDGPGQLAVAGALSRHRLLGADRLRPPRGSDPRLCRTRW